MSKDKQLRTPTANAIREIAKVKGRRNPILYAGSEVTTKKANVRKERITIIGCWNIVSKIVMAVKIKLTPTSSVDRDEEE